MAIEPAAAGGVSLSVILVSLLGPTVGPYVLIVLASMAGALWPLSAKETATRWEGAKLMLRCTLTAVALSVTLAALLDRAFGIPANEGLAPVALMIGALGDGWRPVFDAVGAALRAVIGKRAEQGNE